MHTSSAQGTGTPSSDIVVDTTHAKTVNITIQAGAAGVSTAAPSTVQDVSPIQGFESPQIRSEWNYLPAPNLVDRNGERYGAYNLSLLNPGWYCRLE